jgi:dienelactone hydrolase
MTVTRLRYDCGMWMLSSLLLLAAAQTADYAKPFEYDAGTPLNATRKLLGERDGVRVFDVLYDSPRGGKVTAFVVEPSKQGARNAGIVFGHWGPGDRSEFLPEAKAMARLGVVCVLVDYPWKRPAPWYADADDVMEPDRAVQLHRQAVVDLRRAIDLLLAREDVDPARLAYVGHSYGAQFGAILAAVDKRLKAVVLMGGIPDMDSILLEGRGPALESYREKNLAQIRESLKKLRATAAVEFVPHAAPVPLLFQFAKYEWNFGVPAMERYFQAASEPKSVRWYETGHELNDPQALADRTRWLAEKLRLRGVDATPVKR